MCLRGKKRKAFLILQTQSGSIARDYELRLAGTHPFIHFIPPPQTSTQSLLNSFNIHQFNNSSIHQLLLRKKKFIDQNKFICK